MFWFKSCPQCRGDLFQERDHYGWYISCLQCGHHLNEVEEAVRRYVGEWPIAERGSPALAPKTNMKGARTSPQWDLLAA